MAKSIFARSFKAVGAASALLAASMLLTNCQSENSPAGEEDVVNPNIGVVPPLGGPPLVGPGLDVPVAAVPVPAWDFIKLMVKIDPLEPYDERFLDDWRFQLQNIDDQGRPLGPAYFGESGPDGTAAVGAPLYMFQLPLVIRAFNDAYPLLDTKRRALVSEAENIPNGAREDEGDIINRCIYGECEGFTPGHHCRCGHKHHEDGHHGDHDRDHHGCDGGCHHGDHDRDHHGCDGGCRHGDHDHEGDHDRDHDHDRCEGGRCGHHDHDGDHHEHEEGPVVNTVPEGALTPEGGPAVEGGIAGEVPSVASEDDASIASCRRCGERHKPEHKCKKHKKKEKEKHQEFECRHFEIFVPPGCYNQAIWLLGPLESAVWDYYERANRLRGEAWNASQVDCATWLANLQLLIQTDKVNEELHEIAEQGNTLFDPRVLVEAFQENQNFLVPTRPPICMAERRHTGGGLEEGFVLEEDDFPYVIGAGFVPFENVENSEVQGPELIVVNEDGMIRNLCGQRFDAELRVNDAEFEPTRDFVLRSAGDFMGTVHKQDEIVKDLNARLFNIRLGNGRPLDSDVYNEACALTQLVEFTNIADEDQNLSDDTGFTFFDLFEKGRKDTEVWLSSDGDNVVNDDDTWIILKSGEEKCREKVLAIELVGHRAGDYRDVLFMERRDNHGIPENDGEDLFIGLRADYRLEEETIDGMYGFMAYTVSYWDGSTEEGHKNIRTQIASCYEAADVWARQFFITHDFQKREGNDCCFDDCCKIEKTICPLRAAEMAVRSQCFSNSRSNSRWQTVEVGLWSLNNNHGVHGNVVVNPGWLAPNMDFEVYIQRFDQPVFQGPRTIVTSDCYGQIMTALPLLVEGDRVLLKAQDACCSDYDLVLPCVPEFTGFLGLPGVAYVPQVVGPVAPIVAPAPVPVPVPVATPVAVPVVAPVAAPVA